MTAKSFAFLAAVALSAVASAQTWSRSYESGLTAARSGKWSEARDAFQQAAAGRPDDRSAPTVLPGPVDVRRLWRDGAPYSPNFLAAYSLYRQALATSDPIESARQMRTAASELETLIAKDQASNEAFFFLDLIYTRLGDMPKQQATVERKAKLGRKADWKVDTEIVAPEELAAMGARTSGATTSAATVGGSGGSGPSQMFKPSELRDNGAPIASGAVAAVATKFALIVGQSQSRIPGGAVPYGTSDAQRVRDALVTFAGYPEANVVMLQNVSAGDMKAAAAALSTRIDQASTVVIYYVGAGVNLSGKDYLAGVDTETSADTASMLPKTDLFAPFVERGARIFAFFEASRPIDANGFYFGREGASLGSISQVQATRPNDKIGLTYRDNQPVGLFTNAFVQTLGELRSNRLPVFEFTWQVFYAMRRGSSGSSGGGSTQVCTLPQLTNLAADAKF